jgi:hypothetical protein
VHQFSFDFNDPVFDLHGWRLGLQVVTFENTYGLDPARTAVTENRVDAAGLTSAGGRNREPGTAWIEARTTADGIEVTAGATHPGKIRCLKLLVDGLPAGEITGRRWELARTVPPNGLVYRYPAEPFLPLAMHTPLVFLSDPAGGHVYFRSLDDRVRAKRFTFQPRGDFLSGELIHEESAHVMTTTVETPPWRIGRCAEPGAIVEEHLVRQEQAFSLQAWERRADVPDWAREISLVASIHGMHWTGYTFNTYADVLATLEWICERIDGRRVLAFLPGWEGRYYWQYGDYRPEPLLGGTDGFKRLTEGARKLGVTLMPMFGANCANTNLTGFDRWGAPSILRSASGMEFQGNRPDWDTSRAHDPGWQSWLNPGAPAWRERLLAQVGGLLTEYGLSAAFFDTHHIWDNDPHYPLYEGLAALRDELRERVPDILLAGEGWYDALGAITPVSQVGAPAQWEQAFYRYCRTFAHLMWGDPSRGSSGVHEAGHTGSGLVPDSEYWWPTVTIVDGTIKEAPGKVEQVIDQAKQYAKTYL